MTKFNPQFSLLSSEYIFSTIEKKLEEHQKQSRLKLINLGIGDVALPLAPIPAKALMDATEEMTKDSGMRGYGPSTGYSFLKKAIASNYYNKLEIAEDEIFISDGINSDCVNIQDLFALNSVVAIADPTYPAYFDSTLLSAKAGKILRLPCTKESQFIAELPEERADWVYLCSPNNPTGVAMNRSQLTKWVAWAKKHQAILLFDSAYSAFVSSGEVPKTIYEIDGAKDVAIEFCSLSKSAGFTGLRCGFCVVPKNINGSSGDKIVSLNELWSRRQSIKFNGVAYPIQRAAEAAFSATGQSQTKKQIALYKESATILQSALIQSKEEVWGGSDSPYIWWKISGSSWGFFDLLLAECSILAIPGKGFGKLGEGFIRLSAFTTPELANEAASRLLEFCAKRENYV